MRKVFHSEGRALCLDILLKWRGRIVQVKCALSVLRRDVKKPTDDVHQAVFLAERICYGGP